MLSAARSWVLFASAITMACIARAADEPKAKAPIPFASVKRATQVDFEREVLPILRKNCLACHSQSRPKGGLVLESPKDILKGGDSGKAIVPRRGSESFLLKAAAHQKEPFMPPPENKSGAVDLTPQELGILKLWIDQGAKGSVRQARAVTAWQPQPEALKSIYSVALTADGQYAACNRANRIYIYHLPTQQLVAQLVDAPAEKKGTKESIDPNAAHRDLVFSLAFSPDGRTLASGSFREVKLWQAMEPAKVTLDKGEHSSFAATADGQWVAISSPQGVKLWDVARNRLTKTLSKNPVGAMQFSADGSLLLAGGAEGIVVWSVPDGKRVADTSTPAETVAWLALSKTQFTTGGSDGVVHVWELPGNHKEPLRPLKELKGHAGAVRALASVGTNGAQVLSGGADGSLRLWDIAKGKTVRQMAHGGVVNSVAASYDSKRFASAGTNVMAKLWNAADGKLVADVKGNHVLVDRVAMLERDIAFQAGEVNYRKTALQTTTNELKAVVERVGKATNAVAAAEKVLAEKTEPFNKAKQAKEAADKALSEIDAELKTATEAAAKAMETARIAGAEAKAAREAAAPDGEKVMQTAVNSKAAEDVKEAANKKVNEITAKQKSAKDKATAEANALTNAEREFKKAETAKSIADNELDLAKKANEVAQQNVTKAEQMLVATEAAHKKAEADLQATKAALKDSEKPVRAVAFSVDGKTLVTAGDDLLVHTWNAENGVGFEVFEQGDGGSELAGFWPGGWLSTTQTNSKAPLAITLWKLNPPWKLQRVIGGAQSPDVFVDRVNGLAFSPDGQWLAAVGGEPSRSGEIKLSKVATGAVEREFNMVHSDAILGVEFSADGKYLATSASDKFMRVLELDTAKVVKSFEGHTHHVLDVSWRRDGRTLFTAGADNVVKVWDFVTGARKRNIEGFGKEVTSLACIGSSDQFVASAGDGQVRLAQEDGKEIRRFSGATPFVYAVAVTPDGKTVIAGGEDGILRVWNGADGKLLATFEAPASH